MSSEFLTILLWLAATVKACPEKCRCMRGDYLVDCSNRDLTTVPSDLPKWTRKLDLSRNRISSIGPADFRNLSDVRELHLTNNRISHLQNDVFRFNPRLLALYLDQNKLQYLTISHMKALKNIRLLHMSDNYFEYVKSLTLGRHFKRLVSLRMDKNPILCQCLTLQLQPLLRQAEVEYHPAKCGGPPALAGRNVKDLAASDFKGCQTPTDPQSYSTPVIYAPPKSQEWTPGFLGRLYCRARGVPTPGLAWYKDGRIITGADRRNIASIDGTILQLSEVHKTDSGVYKCVAANVMGRAEAHAAVTVTSTIAPIITQKPVDQETTEGGNVQFLCSATGRPQPNIRWIQKYIFSQMLSTHGRYVVQGGSLTVRNVTKSDEKSLFICTASSEYGSTQAGAQIRVLDKVTTSLRPNVSPRYIYGESVNDGQYQTKRSTTANIQIRTGYLPKPIIGEKKRQEIFNKAIAKARIEVSKAINATVRRLRNRNLRRTPVDIATLFRQPNEEAIRLSRAAVIYERAVEQIELILRRNQLNISSDSGDSLATRLLSDDQLGVIARLSGCQRQSEENIDCGIRMCFHNRFRSIDGTCNNLHRPRQGAALSPFHRMLPPQYENGVNEPIGWRLNKLYGGYPKPSARLVSLRLLSAPAVSRSKDLSAMVMQWGQFLDHDLDFTPVDASNRRFSDGVTCNETCVNESPCFPIIVPPDDKRIRRRPCIGFSRSSATCGSGATSLLLGKPHFREQINQITSFIDASNVYGSHNLEAEELRQLEYDEGKLREGMPTINKTRLLPFNTRAPVDCQIDSSQLHVPCFLAGDHRANENLGLLSIHTLWLREHNRIVTRLRMYNPHWSGDRLYYEGRKIVGAFMQHITYNAWLPKILGRQGMIRFGRRYRGYDDRVDPSISNVFATAAFRFGHTLINPILYRLNQTFGEIKEGHLALHKAFFAPHRIVQEGGIDPIIRGLMAAGMKKVTPRQPMNTELTENLFKLAHEVALDLGALNIQRGRDHGLPGYVAWRRVCNLSVPQDFEDLRWEIPDPHIRERLRQVYGHPDNIDLFAGAVLEEPSTGAQIGPTFACLIIDQFQRLRSGDRFWYENPTQFSPTQLTQLRKVTLARIICDNSDSILRVAKDVFMAPRYIEDYIDCSKIPSVDLGSWKECQYDQHVRNDNILFERGRSLRRTRRSVNDNNHWIRKMNSMRERIHTLENQMSLLALKVVGGV